jgi:quercetin dioxygenase-like cupin family protein
MEPQQHMGDVVRRIAEEAPAHTLDVFGPTVEFLRRPVDEDAGFCVMRGVVPPGVTVPLHSHADAEDFYIVDGTQQVLTHGSHGLESPGNLRENELHAQDQHHRQIQW